MNSLIKIEVKNDQQLVSARELHKALEVKRRFSAWVTDNFKYFEKEVDYTTVLSRTEVQNNGGVQQRDLQDYAVTLDMAKELCMMSKTPKGKEVWKPYPEYPFIQANQFGEIRTIDRDVTYKNGVKRHYKGHMLKQWKDRDGYLFVNFRVNGKLINLKVHRVVASCFLPNPDGLPEVNHIDCNRTNNNVDNLEWCTGEYNVAYREKYGTALNHPVFAVNLRTSNIQYFESQNEAARQLGVDRRHVNHVLKGRYKQTSGYWFCYADSNAVEITRLKFGDEVADKVKTLLDETIEREDIE